MTIRTLSKSLLRNLFRQEKVERQLDDELQGYVSLLTDEKTASGLPQEEARRRALIELGGMTQVKQAVRESRAGTNFESICQDVRFGWRMLKRSRSFTFAAILSLGLGMGATTAIFSAVYSLLIRPLAYPEAQRLVWISNFWPKVNMDSVLSPDFVAARVPHTIVRTAKCLHGRGRKPYRGRRACAGEQCVGDSQFSAHAGRSSTVGALVYRV